MNLAKLTSIGIALLLIQACSHPIEIEGEGDVTSQSGDRDCYLGQDTSENTVCNNVVGIDLGRWPELVAVDYAETYTPAPRSGWVFSHWVRCPATAFAPDYACSFQIPKDVVDDYWGKTMPSLKAVFCPENDPDCDGLFGDDDPCPANPTKPCALIRGSDIVESIGRQWAQPDLFMLTPEKAGASWKQMNAACPSPSGICKDSAVLNGIDVTGWTWAGFRDVAHLYISFGASSLPTDIPASYNELASVWGPAVYDAGFRFTLDNEGPGRTLYFQLPFEKVNGIWIIPPGAYAGHQEYDNPASYDAVGSYYGVIGNLDATGGFGMLLHRPIPAIP